MNSHKLESPPSLDEFLTRNREAIIQTLLQDPMVEVTYSDSPRDEKLGITRTVFFGVYARGKVFDVWTLDEDADDPLLWEDSFRFADQAKTHLLLRASQVQAEKAEDLNEQKDLLWEDMKSFFPTLTSPFRFFDNSICPGGLVLEFQSDVFDFFQQNLCLVEPGGKAENCHFTLYDANGNHCWLAVNHRGEMALLPFTQKAI